MRAPICDLLGIDHPIVGFTPSEHVAAAISRAGGLGVLGCVRFNDPAELDAVLDWMDANTGGRPYGVDVVMPARVPAEGAVRDLEELIPPAHRDFVARTLLELGVPPLPDGAPGGEGVIGWLHSVARKHVEVALSHPARLIANALGPPRPTSSPARTSAACWWRRWRERRSTPATRSRAGSTSSSRRGTRQAGTPARSAAWC